MSGAPTSTTDTSPFQIRETLARAFSSFLAIPTVVIVVFILLAAGSYALDRTDAAWVHPVRAFMARHVFADAGATSNLLGTVAGGVITITSITFSLLLLALQQSAAAMTAQVFDQFLRRRLNQVYFGFFVGLAIHALITLATVNPSFNPVIGGTLALILTGVALYILLLLIYSTISQMRPPEIMRAIHDHTLAARQRQLATIARTRRTPALAAPALATVTTQRQGFLVGFDLNKIARAIEGATSDVEVVFRLSIGAYVALHDPVADVHAGRREDAEDVAGAVQQAVHLDRTRQLETDPAFGIEQLETIAWRSVSTSQQNPAPGMSAVYNLRDILARWAEDSGEKEQDQDTDEPLPVVYPDNVMSRLVAAFEALTVVASESMQFQVYAAILQTFALMFPRLPDPVQDRVEDVVRRSLSALGDHVLTADLDDALVAITAALARAGRNETAAAVAAARVALARSIGVLNSRSTRVPPSS